ncbi:hypothetical protein H4582DRAFT_998384 [Lactarius indigo]|nr:hypothetical protein H4582DRAFT_998384 [Lactarius indigo]
MMIPARSQRIRLILGKAVRGDGGAIFGVDTSLALVRRSVNIQVIPHSRCILGRVRLHSALWGISFAYIPFPVLFFPRHPSVPGVINKPQSARLLGSLTLKVHQSHPPRATPIMACEIYWDFHLLLRDIFAHRSGIQPSFGYTLQRGPSPRSSVRSTTRLARRYGRHRMVGTSLSIHLCGRCCMRGTGPAVEKFVAIRREVSLNGSSPTLAKNASPKLVPYLNHV